eukprot:scaffold224913_cov36-Tisochrysis_lutea.AAC.3
MSLSPPSSPSLKPACPPSSADGPQPVSVSEVVSSAAPAAGLPPSSLTSGPMGHPNSSTSLLSLSNPPCGTTPCARAAGWRRHHCHCLLLVPHKTQVAAKAQDIGALREHDAKTIRFSAEIKGENVLVVILRSGVRLLFPSPDTALH